MVIIVLCMTFVSGSGQSELSSMVGDTDAEAEGGGLSDVLDTLRYMYVASLTLAHMPGDGEGYCSWLCIYVSLFKCFSLLLCVCIIHDCLGCAVLLCLVCLFDLARFFLSSLIKTCIERL